MAKKEETIETQESQKTNRIVNFAQETKQELAKIVWPSRQQLISESVAVILMVILVASVIYLVDNVLSLASGKVF